MGKKKMVDAVVDDAAKQAEARLSAIRQFNMDNAGDMWIDPEHVPTEEEIKQSQTDFEDRTKALQEKKDYLVADAANALRVAKFLKNFVENGFWTQRYYVGVINFASYIDEFIAECEKEPKDLVMEYGPLQFCMLMLENYAGFGLEAAKKMAEMWDEYVPIYDTLRDHIEWYNAEVKACEKLKQRWGMMSMGYYMVILDPTPEMCDGQKEFDIPGEVPADEIKENTECADCSQADSPDPCCKPGPER